MKTRRNKPGQASTKYIQLDTRKCEACWKCMEACPANVFGRVNLPWHKHALISRGDRCIGCTKCIRACEFNAITKVSDNDQVEKPQKKNSLQRFVINIGLFFTALVTVYSGFLIQFGYHIGQQGKIDENKKVLDINYSGWSGIHKMSISLLSVFIFFHIVQHWKWYKTVIKKHLITKHKQVFILLAAFTLAAITGYTAWLIDLIGSSETARKFFLEIHDKLTIILFVFLILHIAKRLNWFMITLKKY